MDPKYRFIDACISGDLETVKILLRNPYFDISEFKNRAFRLACENNHSEVVKQLLTLTGSRTINTYEDWQCVNSNHALSYAKIMGFTKVIELIEEHQFVPER